MFDLHLTNFLKYKLKKTVSIIIYENYICIKFILDADLMNNGGP